MVYGSVCSGIEAPTVAWHPLGWQPAFFSEIVAFPCAVLKHYYPEVSNLGDVTKIHEQGIPEVDLLVAGTPCQSFSVAGQRAGLDDPRGILALEFMQLARFLKPRWVLWENVSGVLSKREDFFTILSTLAQCGYGFAYRVLDAQYFGVPQRRRRVFVVGYLGDWRPPAAVLFESESLRRHSAKGRKTGEEITGTLGDGSSIRGWCDDPDRATFIPAAKGGGNQQQIEVSTSLNAGCTRRLDFESDTFVVNARQTPAVYYSHDYAHDRIYGADGVANAICSSNTRIRQSHFVEEGVRRLTPLEWERLQGFPDGYTLIPYKGKPAADGPRYQALGNSMAVPVIRWLGERIQLVENN